MKNIRDGYKMTELGEIPDEWKVEKLKDVAKVIDSLHETPIYSEDGFPMIRVVDVNGKAINVSNANKVSEEVYNKFTRKYKPKLGDIIMSRVGSYGLVSYLKTNDKICLGQNIVIITTDYCKKYLFYALNSNYIKSNIDRVTVGSSQKTLSLANINEFKLVLPTIKEQEKIASILSTVDEQIDNVDALIEKNKELKKGLMQTLLTKGIGHIKFKKTEIGEIPEEWEVVKLGEVCDFKQGFQIPRSEQILECKEGYIRYLYITDFFSDNNKLFIKESKKYYYIEPRDIAIANTGNTCGKAFRGATGVLSNNMFKIFNDKNRISDNYLWSYLNSDYYWNELSKYFNTAGQPHVGHKNMSQLKIALPDKLIEQEKISSILSEVDKKIEGYENKKQKLEELKKGLMQKLLTGSIRVF